MDVKQNWDCVKTCLESLRNSVFLFLEHDVNTFFLFLKIRSFSNTYKTINIKEGIHITHIL